MKDGIHLGAIAGLIGGIPIFIANILFFNRHLWSIPISEIGFLLGQLGTHLFFNMIWGIVLGIIYSKTYGVIPKKGVLKGIIFGILTGYLYKK